MNPAKLPPPKTNPTRNFSQPHGFPNNVFHLLGIALLLAVFTTFQSPVIADEIFISSDENVTNSTSGAGTNVLFRDEDIIRYNTNTGDWDKFFDGSTAGLTGNNNIDAFHIDDNDDIYMSFSARTFVPGILPKTNSQDIVFFDSSSQTFSLFFDGSDVKLTRGTEDIDAITFDQNGDLVISTSGFFIVSGLIGGGEDLIIFNDTSFGPTTAGTFEQFFDGSSVGLERGADLNGNGILNNADLNIITNCIGSTLSKCRVADLAPPPDGDGVIDILDFSYAQSILANDDSENIWGTSIDADSGDVFLNLKGDFDVSSTNSLSGTDDDIINCVPQTVGPIDMCMFFEVFMGDDEGFPAGRRINAIQVVLNDPPVITSDGGGATASVNADENQTAVTDVQSTDPDGDLEGAGLTYSKTGGADEALFGLDPNTGVLVFLSPPNFEDEQDAGADNVYDVQVTVTDSGGLTDFQDIAVTVTDVNEAPEITSDGGGATASIFPEENQTAVTDVDSTDDSDTEGAGLTYSLTGGADVLLFSIVGATGVLTFNVAPNFEIKADVGGDGVYDVQVTVTDSGTGTLTDVQDIAVTVTDVNEAPIITSDGGGATALVPNVAENQTAVTNVNSIDPEGDVEGAGLTYSLTMNGGGVDNGFFTLGSLGLLTFTSAPDFEDPRDAGSDNTYDVQVTVTDSGPGTPLTDVQDIAVTVTDVNEAPEITSDGGGATASIFPEENQTAVTDVDSTDDSDLEGAGLTYSLTGGADVLLFSIVGATGVLTFNAAPNFEIKADVGADGVYDVEVTVTDSALAPILTDVQNIAVTVTDVNEAPIITSDGGGATATKNAAENQTAVTDVNSIDPEGDVEGAGLTYSLTMNGGGVDNGFFTLGSLGLLTFTSAPDFEDPRDAGSDNTYDVQVTVTDSGPGTPLTDVQDIAVTVTDVNEAPEITSDGGGATASIFPEENQTAVTDVDSTDDSDLEGAGLTYSLTGGADVLLFSIVGATGVLTFNAAPNFEIKADVGGDGVYDVQVTVTDSGTGTLTDVQDIAVTVTDVNEAPIITSDGGGATALVPNVAENQTAVTNVNSIDPEGDVEGAGLTYSLTMNGGGVDNGFFTLGSLGLLTFTSAPDFEDPRDAGSDNTYDVQVTVTDSGPGTPLTDVQDIAVTVTDVSPENTAPVITGGATDSVNAAENQTSVTDVDSTDDNDSEGAGLTYSLTMILGGVDNGFFTLGSLGLLTFTSPPDFEVPRDAGADNTYDVEVTVTDSGPGIPLTAVQNIAVNVTDVVVEEVAPTVTTHTPANISTGNALDTDITVTFSEAVTAPSGAFTIVGASSGSHTFVLSGGPTIFTLNPDVDFDHFEVVTLTVVAANVTDVDVEDPPDNMAADFMCVFSTIALAPDAMDDALTTTEDTNLAEDLFADNGSGADDLGIPTGMITFFGSGDLGGTIFLNTAPATVPLAGGMLTVNATGSITLTGQPFTTGEFTFDYRLFNTAGTDDATVTITIDSVNTVPSCVINSPDGEGFGGDVTVDFDAVSATGNNLTAAFEFDAGGGFMTATDAGTGGLTGNPTASFTAATGHTWDWDSVNDITGSALVTLRITVEDTVTNDTSTCETMLAVSNVDAINDTYTGIIGNVGLDVPAGNGVLFNDLGGATAVTLVNGLAVVGSSTPTTNGDVTVQANGSFVYEPDAGNLAPDSFTYEADGADTATVNLTFGTDVVWFIDSTPSGAGDVGTLSDPFDTISGYNGSAAAASQGVFFATGSYNGTLLLKNNSIVIGEGTTGPTAVLLGVTEPTDSRTLPTVGGTAPSITNFIGNGIELATGNTIRGLDIGSTTGIGMNGSDVGSLIVSDVSISGTGQAVDINGSTLLDATFDSISSSISADMGIKLASISAGTFTVTGGTTITSSADRGVEISSSPATTFTFADLDVSTTNDIGIFMNGGTLNTTSGTISTGSGRGIDISNATLGVTLTSVTNSGAPNGIILTTTTGSFTVTGDGGTDVGGNGTGGTILNATGDAINLNITGLTFTLSNMNITNPSGDGIESNGGTLNVNNNTFDQVGAAVIHPTSAALNGSNNSSTNSPCFCDDGGSNTNDIRANVQTAICPNDESIIHAIAYIDVDATNGYNPVAGDVMIAGLFEANGDGVLSIGDEIHFGSYPLDFNASATASFNGPEVKITAVLTNSTTLKLITTAAGGQNRF